MNLKISKFLYSVLCKRHFVSRQYVGFNHETHIVELEFSVFGLVLLVVARELVEDCSASSPSVVGWRRFRVQVTVRIWTKYKRLINCGS